MSRAHCFPVTVTGVPHTPSDVSPPGTHFTGGQTEAWVGERIHAPGRLTALPGVHRSGAVGAGCTPHSSPGSRPLRTRGTERRDGLGSDSDGGGNQPAIRLGLSEPTFPGCWAWGSSLLHPGRAEGQRPPPAAGQGEPGEHGGRVTSASPRASPLSTHTDGRTCCECDGVTQPQNRATAPQGHA